MAEEIANLTDSIADELKAFMVESGQEKVIIGEYKLSYTEITRKDLDKKALEADHTDIYYDYLIETTYKRFLVS
jgi:predicted phage-related endonuclease